MRFLPDIGTGDWTQNKRGFTLAVGVNGLILGDMALLHDPPGRGADPVLTELILLRVPFRRERVSTVGFRPAPARFARSSLDASKTHAARGSRAA